MLHWTIAMTSRWVETISGNLPLFCSLVVYMKFQCNDYIGQTVKTFVDAVKNIMNRYKFESIKKNWHLCDNLNLDKEDKFPKIRPILNKLTEKYLQFGIFARNLSIDEQIVPYFGRHSCKFLSKVILCTIDIFWISNFIFYYVSQTGTFRF